ncbi:MULTISPECIES: NAD(P)-dependent malic enzyme [Clostridium]|uniref:NAD(P)-dependent malic enzyme n=1 Tax=Clostridium TaxID=1485 RepID=UPI00082627B9|nr:MULTISPECIES: NADP-dependent malic enzyme [Clostridium]PJI08528.1 NADP-dependent malic enzyme [Clostridium sp. CT7]
MEKEDVIKKSLELHKNLKGMLQISAKASLENKSDLATIYTPGVSGICKEICNDVNKAYDYTIKGTTIAIITNGTAVLGLGDTGATAGLPVIEAKALLLKKFGNVNAFPICINSSNKDDIVNTIEMISSGFGGIHLEDIKAPECFYIEDKLKKDLNIPVYHDDQHGTAVAVLAGIYNAAKLVNKKIEELNVMINGAGASGIATAKLLLKAGVKNIVLNDIKGAIAEDAAWLNDPQRQIAKLTNRKMEHGKVEDLIKGKDVFIGLSVGNVLTKDMVKKMNKDSIIFALANPVPEIMPDEAKKGGAKVIATGRSDFPNQINNLLVFPGIFKGALELRVSEITDEMKLRAAQSIAKLVSKDKLNEEYIIPDAFDNRVSDVVANAVKDVAIKNGLSRVL